MGFADRLLQAKEFALTMRIKAQRAVDLGLANHVVEEAIACAKKLLALPPQAVEATKQLMNIQLEKAVMASLDYANLAEYVSFGAHQLRQDRRRPDRQG